VAVIIWTQVYSIQKFNIFGHINKYVKVTTVINGFKQGIGPGMLSIIDFLIGLLDIVSELAKSLSLSIRLFGNMFAGELLSGIVLSAFALVAPVPLMLLALFTGFLQALVFGALTSSYFGLALSDD
jgi:F-type H+-transporting ATPase subunit a